MTDLSTDLRASTSQKQFWEGLFQRPTKVLRQGKHGQSVKDHREDVHGARFEPIYQEWLPSKSMVEHTRQNRDKHVRHSQIYFVGRAIQSGYFLRPTFFNTSRTSHSVTNPSQPAASASGIAAKLLYREIRQVGKTIPKMRFTYVTVRLDRLDIPTKESSKLFLASKRVTLHGFVRNST